MFFLPPWLRIILNLLSMIQSGDVDAFHPHEVYETFKEATNTLGVEKEQEWNALFESYKAEHNKVYVNMY